MREGVADRPGRTRVVLDRSSGYLCITVLLEPSEVTAGGVNDVCRLPSV